MPTDTLPPLPATEQHADLRPLNTFGLPGRADRLLRIDDPRQIAGLAQDPHWRSTPRLVLGGGSNLVLTGDFRGTVLKVAIAGRALVGEDAGAYYVAAGGGENWHDFVRWTLAQGWAGLENLSLIPGTVGAAPIQNIGAYGLELGERFHRLDAVELDTGETRSFDAAACRFGYRDSVFKQESAGRFLIGRVVFRLPRPWQPVLRYAELAREVEALGIAAPTALDVSDAVIAIRRRKLPDPAELGNAGSFFKNPVVDASMLARLLACEPDMPHHAQPDGCFKLAAGWLIDRCGWKGRNLGPVGAYDRQALVLVNRGGACGADVLRAAQAIRDDVHARFGVVLEAEPCFV